MGRSVTFQIQTASWLCESGDLVMMFICVIWIIQDFCSNFLYPGRRSANLISLTVIRTSPPYSPNPQQNGDYNPPKRRSSRYWDTRSQTFWEMGLRVSISAHVSTLPDVWLTIQPSISSIIRVYTLFIEWRSKIFLYRIIFKSAILFSYPILREDMQRSNSKRHKCRLLRDWLIGIYPFTSWNFCWFSKLDDEGTK